MRLFKESFSFFHKLISEEWIPKHFQQKRGGGGGGLKSYLETLKEENPFKILDIRGLPNSFLG